MTIGITPYSNTDADEIKAIKIFDEYLDDKIFKKYFNARDKTPNHDNYFEIVNDDDQPIATLFVQIKKFPKKGNKGKIKLPLSLYHYQNKTNPCPVLFISSDIENKIVYWVYIHDNLLNTKNEPLKDLKNQKTTTILINNEQFDKGMISEKNRDNLLFRDNWLKICETHIRSKNNYNYLLSEYNNIKKVSEPTLLKSDEEFINIHKFLDVFNNEIKNFPVILERFYPNSWKLGFIYSDFLESYLSYMLFPIPWEVNDIEIRKVNNIEELSEKNSGFKIEYQKNPLYGENYEEYTLEIIKDNLDKIFKDRMLFIPNEFICNELIFAFFSKYKNTLKLESKCEYSIIELKNCLIHYVQTQELINSNYTIFHKFSLILILECLSFLESKNIGFVKRIYPEADTLNNTRFGYNGYTDEDIIEILEIMYSNIHESYNDIFNSNFKNLNHLNHFLKYNGVFIVYHPAGIVEEPCYDIFYCKSDTKEFFYKVFHYNDNGFPAELKHHPKINTKFSYRNINYEYLACSSGIACFVYSDSPLFLEIYNLLKKDLKNYLEQKNTNSAMKRLQDNRSIISFSTFPDYK